MTEGILYFLSQWSEEIDSLDWGNQFDTEGPFSEDVPVNCHSRGYKGRAKLEVNLDDFNSYTDSEFSEVNESESLEGDNASNLKSESED